MWGVRIRSVLETCVYATDLIAAERFYESVLGLEVLSRQPGRHVFYRCGPGVFLVFNPDATRDATSSGVPPHGSDGPAHIAFAVADGELDDWRARIRRADIPIEAEVEWPRGGRSLYLRDPAGNSIELASPRIWGISDSSPA